MELMTLISIWKAIGELLIVNLTGSFAPASIDQEASHWTDAILCRREGSNGYGQTKTQGADYPGGDDGNASIFYVRIGKSHPAKTLIPIAFSIEALY